MAEEIRLRIRCDRSPSLPGGTWGTRIEDQDGRVLSGVLSATWSVGITDDGEHSFTKATITLEGVTADLIADFTEVVPDVDA